MKKIILTTMVCLFLSLNGYAQAISLDKFFAHYAEQDRFSYVFYGNEKDLSYAHRFPDNFRGEVSSLNFIKSLYCRALSEETPEEFITNLKGVLMKENFVLVKSIKSNKNRSETYQKKTDSDFEQVTLIVSGSSIQVRWESGKLKK
jgi:hypothetical protein